MLLGLMYCRHVSMKAMGGGRWCGGGAVGVSGGGATLNTGEGV